MNFGIFNSPYDIAYGIVNMCNIRISDNFESHDNIHSG